MAKPFLKWAGGKRQLVNELRTRMPERFKRYYEPFVGAGALFFSLRPKSAVLSDINEELINVYLCVRDDLEAVIDELSRHENSEEYYYEIRSWDRDPAFPQRPAAQRAARFIFLNRTCFNGLYRVNSKGHFNVPFGRYLRPRIIDEENLLACRELLRHADIRRGSFEAIEEELQHGDFVYLDPPYVPLSTTASFTSYYKDGFSTGSQLRLREFCERISERGAKFLLSNSDTDLVREEYSDFNIDSVLAARAVNSNASKRGKISELVVRNF